MDGNINIQTKLTLTPTLALRLTLALILTVPVLAAVPDRYGSSLHYKLKLNLNQGETFALIWQISLVSCKVLWNIPCF